MNFAFSAVLILVFVAIVTHAEQNCWSCEDVCGCRSPTLKRCAHHSHCFTTTSTVDVGIVEKMGCSSDCSTSNPYTQQCRICYGDRCNVQQGLLPMTSRDDQRLNYDCNSEEALKNFRRAVNLGRSTNMNVGETGGLYGNSGVALGTGVSNGVLEAGQNFNGDGAYKVEHRDYPNRNGQLGDAKELGVGRNFKPSRNFNEVWSKNNFGSDPTHFENYQRISQIDAPYNPNPQYQQAFGESNRADQYGQYASPRRSVYELGSGTTYNRAISSQQAFTILFTVVNLLIGLLAFSYY